MHLNRKCTEYRKKYPEVKTLLRFGTKDIELLMKTKGSSEPLRIVPYSTVDDNSNIPKFDNTRKWKARTTIPNRRKKNYNPDKEQLPSRSNQEEATSPNTTQQGYRKDAHQISRTSTLSRTSSLKKPTKKPRLEDPSTEKEDTEIVDLADVDMVDPLSTDNSQSQYLNESL